ncbi:MAG: RIP metalloprotease RseP [Flavobacteriales bacterium]|nr:RIP metalloprotease RseP [Flavobacteriales bacterium]
MEILIKAAQLLLSLSILVILHELGHFIPAKLFKTRVEKFYLFFDPWFSLVKKKVGGTEYGVGWLPLGGYVKISGMIDESMDTNQMSKEPEPWEFRAKPAWQRLIIMLGGVTVNVILAFFIYVFAFMTWGDQYLPTQNTTYGIYCDSLGLVAGFENGDKIISVGGKKMERFNEVVPEIILNDVKTVRVKREGESVDVSLSEEVKLAMLSKKNLFELGLPFIIEGFSDNSAIEAVGAKKGDQIISINNQDMSFAQDVFKYVPTLKGDSASIVVDRGGELVTLDVYLAEGVMGAQLKSPRDLFVFEKAEHTFLSAVPASLSKTRNTLNNYLKQFKLIKKSPDSVGGFITIGNIFPAVWDWQRFWELTAFLSIMLAVLNVLPIPALDGGHVVFLMYEIFTGRKPHEKVLEYAQITGMILLFALLIYANGNDIIRLFS